MLSVDYEHVMQMPRHATLYCITASSGISVRYRAMVRRLLDDCKHFSGFYFRTDPHKLNNTMPRVKCYDHITVKLTPWSRVLPEKLTGPQLDKKFPAFYENQGFITAFTKALRLCLT
jgi:hypothetical protein